MCAHTHINLQGWRQKVKKTTAACLVAMEYIRRGIPVIAAFPTLRQGGRVILRRIDCWTKATQEDLGLKRIADNQMEVQWSNGGGIMALSTDESAKSGTQGYTAGLIMIDEAHETQPEVVVGPMYPAVSDAMDMGYGKIIQIGVGGARASLAEHSKTLKRADGTPFFHQLHYGGSRMIREYGEFIPPGSKRTIRESYFEDKALYTSNDFLQFVECKPIAAGSRLLYSPLLTACPEVPTTPQYLVGIDSGKVTDYTVAMRIRVGASSVVEQTKTYTVDDIFTVPHNMTYAEQAAAIVEWARPWVSRALPYGKTCELNGVGYGLHEALLELWPDCGCVHITDNAKNLGLKSRLIDELRIAAQNACFAVESTLVLDERGESAHEHFAALTMEVDETGRWVAEHSDYNSAAIVAIYGI